MNMTTIVGIVGKLYNKNVKHLKDIEKSGIKNDLSTGFTGSPDVWIADIIDTALSEGLADTREEVVDALFDAHMAKEITLHRRDLVYPSIQAKIKASEISTIAGSKFHVAEPR